MASTDSQTRAVISSKTRKIVPPLYKVILHNDDYTTMEFVVEILITVFGKPLEKATQTMLNIHHKGNAVCGIYPREIAETKVETVHHLAARRGFPLKSTMEKE
ncbi:MAG: ATP-dependent Clp protease adapter ClpS [Desulfotignum sp.]|jgi:ATP-dependent Clp protease adaptor protein ClpS